MDEYFMDEDELDLEDDIEDAEDIEDFVDLGDAFRDVLHDEYACLSPEDTDEAMIDVFESLSPAESFSFAKALDGLGKGSLAAVKNPTFQQLAGTALPIAGTAFGGPVGGTLAGAADLGDERLGACRVGVGVGADVGGSAERIRPVRQPSLEGQHERQEGVPVHHVRRAVPGARQVDAAP
jgi:hypothetical protein